MSGDCVCRSAPLGELTALHWLDLRDHVEAGKERGKWRNGEEKNRKERSGGHKFLVTAFNGGNEIQNNLP